MIFDTKLIGRTVNMANTLGLKAASIGLFDDLGIQSVSRIGQLPTEGPLLIIPNHSGVFDLMVLCSQMERDDFYFVALITYGIFGTKIRERLLPLFRLRRLKNALYEDFLYQQFSDTQPEELSLIDMRLKNKSTISKAAQLINQGKAVSIFPSGSAGKRINGSSWKAGVGFLIKEITNPKTAVVFAHIQGTKMSDLVAYTHPFIRTLFFRPRPISIHFSKPIYLKKLINQNQDGKTIALNLEKLYHAQWQN